VVADGTSDRIGSATQFVEIPNVKLGSLAMSGLILRGETPAGATAWADPNAAPDVRIFKAGGRYTFSYSVFGALAGKDKQSLLEVHTRIFAAGRVVFDGEPKRVTFGETPANARRQVSGQLNLEPLMASGDYVLQVTVRDLLALPESPARRPNLPTSSCANRKWVAGRRRSIQADRKRFRGSEPEESGL
jgi:hypothetical protein